MSSISAHRAGLHSFTSPFPIYSLTTTLLDCNRDCHRAQSIIRRRRRLNHRRTTFICSLIAVREKYLLRLHSFQRKWSDKASFPFLLPYLVEFCVIAPQASAIIHKHLTQWVVRVEDATRTSGRNRNGILSYELSNVMFSYTDLLTKCFQSLNDFKSTSWMSPLTYGYLWGSLVVSVAVYGVDTFTAVQLLAFNNWTSEIRPAISIEISRWIFSICIILSWVNLGYEYWRAVRVMKRGAVAESYLDSLAVRVQCIRMGSNGRGWKRFLVFTELTKSKKGAEYVALFTYFSFQGESSALSFSTPTLTSSQHGSVSYSVLVLDRS